MASRMTVADVVARETRFGIVPLLRKDRLYSTVDMAFVAGAFAIATWCYYQGMYLAMQMTFIQAVLSTLLVCMAVVVPVTMIGVVSARYGIDHWLSSRATFGYVGTYSVLVLVALSGWGWSAINAHMFGQSMTKIAAAAGADMSNPWWAKVIAALCPLLGFLICFKGPAAVRLSAKIMGIALLTVGAFILVLVLSSGHMGAVLDAPPLLGDTSFGSYMLGTEWNVAFVVAWVSMIGTLGRLAKTERAANWGLWTGYGLLMGVFIVIGVAVTFVAAMKGAIPTGDPTDYLIEVGGVRLGSLALVAIGVANVTTAAVAFYGASLSFKIFWPSLRYERVALAFALLIMGLALWGGIIDYYETYLAIVGAINGPVLALLVADYWLVRRQRLNLKDIFRRGTYQYTGGVNLVALVAFAAGIAAYLWVYDPINAVPRVPSVFNIFTATGLACVVSVAVYLLLAAVPSVRRYLLKDRSGSDCTIC
jgi:nucleobase:cation symporter-1, NCS1 family